MSGKPLILIVEDDDLIGEFIRTVIIEILEYESIGPVVSCREAYETAIEKNPDLIIMDIRLIGEGDGIDAAGKIRTYGLDVPIIFSSASTEESTIKRAEMITNSVFLRKPYEMTDLMTEISNYL
ncbi:MAG: response regulator [Methanomicrobiaceae archaeon]|nr:response regulator [Methanomicrobiaceae archaeon]